MVALASQGGLELGRPALQMERARLCLFRAPVLLGEAELEKTPARRPGRLRGPPCPGTGAGAAQRHAGAPARDRMHVHASGHAPRVTGIVGRDEPAQHAGQSVTECVATTFVVASSWVQPGVLRWRLQRAKARLVGVGKCRVTRAVPCPLPGKPRRRDRGGPVCWLRTSSGGRSLHTAAPQVTTGVSCALIDCFVWLCWHLSHRGTVGLKGTEHHQFLPLKTCVSSRLLDGRITCASELSPRTMRRR